VVVLPKDTSGNKFVTQFLALLPFPLSRERIVELDTKSGPNDVRFDVETLFYPDWEAVRHLGDEPTHCLTPPAVLSRIRSAFVPIPPPRRPVVVYAVRDSERMRRLDSEETLRSALQAALPQGVELVLFRGSESNIQETIALFASAAAVVGVHGGALANIVFCAHGTPVIELGLRAPQTRHFLHASLALGLDYHLVLLDADERSAGAARVSAQREDLEAVGRILRERLRNAGAPDKRDEL
jgi:capsular polysaccharide biosynthesis protein